MTTVTDDPPTDLVVHMHDTEVECYRRHLHQAKAVLEFGCGGTSLMAIEAGCERLDSVESDLGWVRRCEAHPVIRAAGARVSFHHVDVGETGRWGSPVGQDRARDWWRYFMEVWDLLPRRPDLVLVDGRWRVSCCLQAIAEGSPEMRIAFHDFWNRPYYHVVLAFADVVESKRSLAILAPKPVADWRRMARVAARYATDAR